MRYLVGLSPDDAGREALRLALALSRSAKASVVGCLIVPGGWDHPSLAKIDAEYLDFLHRQANQALEGFRKELPKGANVELVARSAPSVSAGLLATASDICADGVILGSSRAACLGRFFEGSAGQTLMSEARLPLFCAPRGYEGGGVKRLTCAVASSSPALVRRAVELAQVFGADLPVATFVVRDKQMVPTGAGYDAEALVEAEFIHQAKARYEEIKLAVGPGLTADLSVGDGRTWETALASLDWTADDLLILGSSAMGPITRIFLGSNGARILHAAQVPVVVLPREAD